MLSSDMQKVILNTYFKYATTGNKSISYDELKEIYKSKVSFKRAINYLLKSNYLHKNRIEYNRVEYSLTLSGEMLARILCSLPNLPEQYKQIRWKLVL